MKRCKNIEWITSAPFLATKSILQLAEENQAALPQAAKAVKESFYVDDGLPSVKTKEEAIVLYQQLLWGLRWPSG